MGCVCVGVRLGGVWVCVLVGGVEEGGVAAEGAHDLDGGLMVMKHVYPGAAVGAVPEEEDNVAVVVSLVEVGAGLGRGLGWGFDPLRGEEGWGRGAVQDRAAAGG
jgi:hypothetical protein